MRDILFRGKRTDNDKWIEGYLIVFPKSKRTKIMVWEQADLDFNAIEVRPETIGQFTGLTDKIGKKIFEGDVVKAVIVRDLGGGTENRQETGVIAYDKIGMIGLVAKYAGSIPIWSDFFQELTLSGCINDFWFEIIGNINDNPELLENP